MLIERVERKDASGAVLLSAEYLYFDNDLLQEVLYGNGTRTVYLYDAADRLQVIEHQGPLGDTILRLVYEMDARGR